MQRLTIVPVGNLINKSELGSLSFESGQRYFELVKMLTQALTESALSLAPSQLLREIDSAIKELETAYNTIAAFKIEGDNPKGRRDACLGELARGYNSLARAGSVVLSLFNLFDPKRIEIEESKDKLANILTAMREAANSALSEAKTGLEKQLIEAQNIVAAIKDTSGIAGVSRHTGIFENEANQHNRMAGRWLVAVVVLGVITGAFSGLSLVQLLFPSWLGLVGSTTVDTANTLQLVVSKIIVFSLLYVATLWASRNYKAHRHNTVANKHRQNALATFESFVVATQNDATRDAVLLRATEAIFSHGYSGYSAVESDSSHPQIIEVLRGTLPKQQ